jgi:hypothetical protein
MEITKESEKLTESAEVKLEATYVLYNNGRLRLVHRTEWEKSWLDWWTKINKVQELE